MARAMEGRGSLVTQDPTHAVDLVAGPATATLENGALRWIRVRDVEVVRGVYGAVRDPGWGTLEPRFTGYEAVQGDGTFDARFAAECRDPSGGVVFTWVGTITGSRDGTIRYAFDGIVTQSFETPRIGLCVLHPPRLAGARVVVETLFGTFRGRFPDLVTGYMPFSNITQIRHDLGRIHETRIGFVGEVFQTEDQRAFTDASFKSFGRPLELPWPFRVDAGTAVRQAVTVAVPLAGSRAPWPSSVGSRHDVVHVAVGAGRLFPAVGSGIAPADVAASPAVADAVRGLGLAHVRATVVTSDPGAPETLDRVADAAGAAGGAQEHVRVGDPTVPALDRLLGSLAARRTRLARVIAVDPDRHTTPRALATRVRAALRAAGITAPLYGGSRGYLYQLVAQGVPADLVDGVTYPANPQVHAFDDASIMETVEALPATVRTAAHLAGGKPVAVGPVSLRAFLNPDRVAPEPPPAPGALPERYDLRQPSAFAAAWTLGAAAALAGAGAASLTLHEAAGWAGLVAASQPGLPPMPAAPGTLLPVGRVVEALIDFTGAEQLEGTPVARLATLAVRRAAGHLDVILANLEPAPRRVIVVPGRRGTTGPTRLLAPATDGSASWELAAGGDGAVDLPAYGVAWLEGRFG